MSNTRKNKRKLLVFGCRWNQQIWMTWWGLEIQIVFNWWNYVVAKNRVYLSLNKSFIEHHIETHAKQTLRLGLLIKSWKSPNDFIRSARKACGFHRCWKIPAKTIRKCLKLKQFSLRINNFFSIKNTQMMNYSKKKLRMICIRSKMGQELTFTGKITIEKEPVQTYKVDNLQRKPFLSTFRLSDKVSQHVPPYGKNQIINRTLLFQGLFGCFLDHFGLDKQMQFRKSWVFDKFRLKIFFRRLSKL